jgi:precorrin-3B synthase
MQTGDGLLVRLNPIAAGQGAEALSPEALIGLCESAARHGNGIMEVTQRGSIQIRGLTPASGRQLALEVDALAIAVRTGVPVETGPLAGLDPDEIADPRPLAHAIRTAVEGAGLSHRLGPKVSMVVDGGGRFTLDDLLADVRLAAIRHEGAALWKCTVGGTAITAKPLGSFPEADACTAAVTVLETIAELGREGRARDLESSALNRIVRRLEGLRVTRHRAMRSIPAPTLQPLGILPLNDTTHALAVALPFGSMPAQRIAGLAREAASLGVTEIRPAPGRVLLALGLSADCAKTLQATASGLGFVTNPVDAKLHIAACPGAPACASGRIATRMLAERIARQTGGLFDGSFALHISGCAKGCAHPAAAPLTLVGGENGVGLVVNGTAGAPVSIYTGDEQAAAGLERIASLVAKNRALGETAAACLTRLGDTRLVQAFAAGRQG